MACLVACCLLTPPASAQLRFVSYNTAGGARDGLRTVLDGIGNEDFNGIQRPIDVLLLQEQLSVSTTSRAIAEMLNELYETNVYQAGEVDGRTLGAGRPGVVYRSDAVQLIDEVPIGAIGSLAQARQSMRYQFRPVGYDDWADFFIYNSHFKAGTSSADQNRRLNEAQALRADADQLDSAPLIYAGDFNIRSDQEEMYRHLLSDGEGRALDPLGRGTTWHDRSASRVLHTQSPVRTARFAGQVTGGIDDRFDFQLVSDELNDSEGMDYIPGSYHVFGNNGSHGLNGEITDGTGAPPNVLEALANSSDHLPVVADYQLPAWMRVAVSRSNAVVALNSMAAITVDVANAFALADPRGWDELDYELNLSSAVNESIRSEGLVPGQVRRHEFPLPTSSVGDFRLHFAVDALSSAAANPTFRHSLDFTVALAGDSNLDGVFDSNDLVEVFQYGQYEASIGGNASWADGDWTGDGDFGSSDLVLAFAAGQYKGSTVPAVPEPAGMLWIAAALLSYWGGSRRVSGDLTELCVLPAGDRDIHA